MSRWFQVTRPRASTGGYGSAASRQRGDTFWRGDHGVPREPRDIVKSRVDHRTEQEARTIVVALDQLPVVGLFMRHMEIPGTEETDPRANLWVNVELS